MAVDVVEQLRMCGDGISNHAADEIDRLRAQLAAAEAALVNSQAELVAQHPECWARITKRLTYERDEARRIAGTLLRHLRNHTDTPDICSDYEWLRKELLNV